MNNIILSWENLFLLVAICAGGVLAGVALMATMPMVIRAHDRVLAWMDAAEKWLRS